MIKKIHRSLTIKIFLITSLLLFLSCALTYGFIAEFMPKTYSNVVNSQIIQETNGLAEKLNSMDYKDFKSVVNEFMLENSVKVVVKDNDQVKNSSIAFAESGKKVNIVTSIITTEDFQKRDPKEIYSLSFISKEGHVYSLQILENGTTVNGVIKALNSILPWLIIVILLISFIGAFIYSRYVTQPIIEISKISAKMSNLEFDWHCKAGRSDEIGVLSESLNEMSSKLSMTLAELEEANATLREDIDRERELEHNRLNFFSAASHELKTPITVIKGQLEGMLHNIGIYRERDKYLARSLMVAESMEGIVQEILAVSRMDSSKFTLQNQDFDFTKLIYTQISCYEELLERKNLGFHVDLDENITINADKQLIQKAIDNLLSNAVYYSQPGGTVNIEAHDTEDKVTFSILNTNAHIPEDQLPRLFEPFYRVEQSRNRQTGGSGLGLYIVEKILEQHNAQYRIENTEIGVKFTFILGKAEV